MLPVTYQAASLRASTTKPTKTLPVAIRRMVGAAAAGMSVGHRLQRREALGWPSLFERRGHFDEGVGIEAVEARSERQRIGADMANFDPVAGVDALRQVEGAREN